MSRQDFLFEIGTEELPAKHLITLRRALHEQVHALLEKTNLSYKGDIRTFVTPRRIAILVPQLITQQPDQVIEKKGPSLAAAFDADGKPTKACEGFARSMGLTVEQLEQRDTPQGICLYGVKKIAGEATKQLLPNIIAQALEKLPIPKPMRWSNRSDAFLRPVRWILMLLGNEVVPATLFDLAADNKTYGHRFLAPQAITIHAPCEYQNKLLKEGYVIADFEARQQLILDELNRIAQENNGQVKHNTTLLEEVSGLVEWPVVLKASFDKRFLNVPANALISAMEHHQKCFALLDNDKKLLPYFLAVSNLVSKNPKQVIEGNERVMHARLSDAEFFFTQDLKTPLDSYLGDLEKVVFQAQLGSLATKSRALATFAAFLAPQLHANAEDAKAAALLAKCDLRTQMVGEFPELQGEMGQIYATAQGIKAEMATALFEQYLPRFSGDQLPATATGKTLAFADRLLNLIGIIGIGQTPTGDKDPFALRRAALGVIRIIMDSQLNMPLRPIILQAKTIWQDLGASFTESEAEATTFNFILERVKNSYLEHGIPAQILQAVFAMNLDNLLDMDQRIKALMIFKDLPEAQSLAAANKRVNNLLQKEKLDISILGNIDLNLLTETAEKTLAEKIAELEATTSPLLKKKQYTEALQAMASIRTAVDQFFNDVMVLTEDKKIRHNRLCLLAQLRSQLSAVADISFLTM